MSEEPTLRIEQSGHVLILTLNRPERLNALHGPCSTVWESYELPLSKAYENGFDILIRHRAPPDAVEGPAAFLEKRPPVWRS
jgi:enoyl-CoA hydratase/carnithine racemase